MFTLSSLLDTADDMTKFGGQARCPECRCLISSLVEASRPLFLNPRFPRYGLCYRTNCYTPDYLQVAVIGQIGGNTVYWYGCPKAGGKIYIPGFTGALHCPPAREFCALEKITGIRFPEQSVLAEAIFWGVIMGLFVLLAIVCLVPQCRSSLVNFTKLICGARQFELESLTPQEVSLAAKEHVPPKSVIIPWASITVVVVSVLLLLLGVAFVCVAIYMVRGGWRWEGAGVRWPMGLLRRSYLFCRYPRPAFMARQSL
jgi:hypothetical protein